MKYSKETVFDTKELRETFGYGKIYEIVNDIISGIDFEEIKDENDLYVEIFNCIDTTLIYTSDQWEIIKHYSVPKEPMQLEIALEKLTNEIFDCKF